MKKKLPSEAQARLLAWLFGEGRTMPVGGNNTPTEVALIKSGWVSDIGKGGLFPSGTEYRNFRITDAGLDALEDYLRKRRYKRTVTEKPAKSAGKDIIWGR